MSLSVSPGAAAPWIVLKFGGTSVSRRDRWDTIGRLASERKSAGANVLVVVSAVSGVTNALQALIDHHADGADRLARAAALETLHREFAATLDLDPDAVIGALIGELHALARDARGDSAQLEWQADLLALGELFSSRLGSAYLQAQGIDLRWSDARDHLRAVSLPNASAWSARLSVNCDTRRDAAWHTRYAAQGDLLITQGFICRDAGGRTAILGRGGSDTSAAYFGALLGAQRVEIWTDVPGMFSANPRAVPQARLLSKLDYEEAQEIATTGAKVLHPRCISPCRDAGVPLWIRDTSNPDVAGTVIDAAAADAAPGVKAISSRRGIVLVSMDGIGMWQQVGFLADVFERFKRHGLSVDLIGSSEANVTVSLDPSDNLVSSNVLEALCADLAEVCRVKVIAPCAAVTLVGRGMRSLLHKLSDVLAEFGRERVHLISQSSNDLNLTFVVDETVADGMLPRLHELLIHAGAMPVTETAVFGPSWAALNGSTVERATPWWHGKRDALLAQADAGTPRYVYDLATVRARARSMRDLGALDRRFYAIKANPHPDILRTLEAEGIGFECVSAGELAHVSGLFPRLDPTRVLFTPSFAARAEYEDALRRDVWITLDSLPPLTHWPELFRGRQVWLRLDPGFGRGHHEKVRTGGSGAKFGLPLSGLDAFLARARALDVRVFGLHAHLGSGIVDPQHWREVFGRLAGIADSIGSIAALNLGGGIGVPAEPDAPVFDIEALARVLSEAKAACPQYALWMEPGRYLVAEAGVLLLRATQVIDKDGVARIGVDGGMNALLRPALYNAWHEIANLTRLHEPADRRFDIVGPICETGDVLARRRALPHTQEGDVLLAATAGAYGAVMASNYNLRGLPQEVAIDE
ncbi:bifunctional aspartate kinase/diaminopimelate decarboxylase [Chiayiivirga flava]|uniref:Diaminopimelate decarboxylase n=1 Tax=Chiayiivirga flava TaxID=659595 RepID=A0A7W8D887_9GAMM|nr:bifunctional aspartate kinase/diaminopimelate decarboxylase [Chiayiivirga flava]MBB5209759.1 diaminopimelate decarboxylase/aspartate kinase [Chiayiivirga flava]